MNWTFNLCITLMTKNSNSQYFYFLACNYFFLATFTFSAAKIRR